MFIGAEIRLDVGFSAAQARLANLAHGGLLSRASENAQKWGADRPRSVRWVHRACPGSSRCNSATS